MNDKPIYKTTFLNTLGICDKVMRTAVEKRLDGFTRKHERGMKKDRKFNEVIEKPYQVIPYNGIALF